MNRGPIVLSIDEAEYLLDQLPPPDKDESPMVTKLRTRLQELLTNLRKGAEDLLASAVIGVLHESEKLTWV